MVARFNFIFPEVPAGFSPQNRVNRPIYIRSRSQCEGHSRYQRTEPRRHLPKVVRRGRVARNRQRRTSSKERPFTMPISELLAARTFIFRAPSRVRLEADSMAIRSRSVFAQRVQRTHYLKDLRQQARSFHPASESLSDLACSGIPAATYHSNRIGIDAHRSWSMALLPRTIGHGPERQKTVLRANETI